MSNLTSFPATTASVVATEGGGRGDGLWDRIFGPPAEKLGDTRKGASPPPVRSTHIQHIQQQQRTSNAFHAIMDGTSAAPLVPPTLKPKADAVGMAPTTQASRPQYTATSDLSARHTLLMQERAQLSRQLEKPQYQSASVKSASPLLGNTTATGRRDSSVSSASPSSSGPSTPATNKSPDLQQMYPTRSFPTVLQRIRNIASAQPDDLHWMPDHHANACIECNAPFNAFRRRHHCRVCGLVFCSKCCSHSISGKLVARAQAVRACGFCARVADDYTRQLTNAAVPDGSNASMPAGLSPAISQSSLESRSSSVSMAENDASALRSRVTNARSLGSVSLGPNAGENLSQQLLLRGNRSLGGMARPSSSNDLAALSHGPSNAAEGSSDEALFGSRGGRAFQTPTRNVGFSGLFRTASDMEDQLNDTVSAEVRERFLQIGADIHTQLVSSKCDLEIKDHRVYMRTYPGTFLAGKLIDWLIKHKFANDRADGQALGQLLLEVKRIEPVYGLRNEKTFRDEFQLYRVRRRLGSNRALVDLTATVDPSTLPPNPDDESGPSWFRQLDESSAADLSRQMPAENNISRLEETNKSSENGGDGGLNFDTRSNNESPFRDMVSPTPGAETSSPYGDTFRSSSFVKDAGKNAALETVTCTTENGEIQQLAPGMWLSFDKAARVPPAAQQCPEVDLVKHLENFNGLALASRDYLERISRQCLAMSYVDLKWLPIVMRLAEIVSANLFPEIREGDSMDFRRYLKVKKVVGDDMAKSDVIFGVSFTGDLVHKRMRRTIKNPRIIILRCAVEHSRSQNAMAGFDSILLQEREYLRLVVQKIVGLYPDLVLVEKSVARVAQEYLLEAGISLAVNVKPSVLDAVARCSGADQLASLNTLTFHPKLGTCKLFRVTTYNPKNSAQKKTLMSFEGCPVDRCCTIILRSHDATELPRVKIVLNYAVFIARSLRLELALLSDMCCCTPAELDNRKLISTPPTALPLEAPAHERFMHVFDNVMLLGSPFLKMSPPYVYTPQGLLSPTRKLLPDLLYFSGYLAKTYFLRLYQNNPNNTSPVTVASNENLDRALRGTAVPAPRFVGALSVEQAQLLSQLQKIEFLARRRMARQLCPEPVFTIPYCLEVLGSVANRKTGPAGSVGAEENVDVNQSLYNQAVDEKAVNRVLPAGVSAETKNQETLSLLSGGNAGLNVTGLQTPAAAAAAAATAARKRPRDCFDPRNHQQLSMLFSSWVSQNNHPCSRPHVVEMSFFGDNDMALGEYLELCWFGSGFECPDRTCQRSIVAHRQSYVHGDMRLMVSMEVHPNRCPMESMYTWAEQPLHKCRTPAVMLSNEAWNVSLGKFFELLWYSTYECSCCSSPLFDHTRYFACGNLSVKFECERIRLMEVIVPAINLQPIRTTPVAWAVDEHDISSGCKEFFYFLDEALRSMIPKVAPFTAPLSTTTGTLSPLQLTSSAELPETSSTSASASAITFDPPPIIFQSPVPPMRMASITVPEESADIISNAAPTHEPNIAAAQAQDINETSVDPNSEAGSANDSNAQSFPLPPPPPVELTVTSASDSQLPSVSVEADSKSLTVSETSADVGAPTGAVSATTAPTPPSTIQHTNEYLRLVAAIEKQLGELDADRASIYEDIKTIWTKTATLNALPGVPPSAEALNMFKDLFKLRERIAKLYVVKMNMLSEVHQMFREWKQTAHFVGPDHPPAPEKPVHVIEMPGSVVSVSEKSPQGSPQSVRVRASVNTRPEPDSHTTSGTLSRQDSALAINESKSNPLLNFSVLELDWSSKSKGSLSAISLPHHTPKFYPPPNIHFGAPNPQRADIHLLAEGLVIENELSTIIGYALSCEKYKSWIDEYAMRVDQQSVSSEEDMYDNPQRERANSYDSDEPSIMQAAEGVLGDISHPDDMYPAGKDQNPAATMRNTFTNMLTGGAALDTSIQHFEGSFQNANVRCYCKVFFAKEFMELRQAIMPDEESYLISLMHCASWHAAGGKSGSSFSKTTDDRFVIKQLSRVESSSFLEFAKSYFEYMNFVSLHQRPSVLAKIVGVYRVGFKNMATGASTKQDVLVMENVFFNKKITRTFDLKGSMRNRMAQATGKASDVLLDENFVNLIYQNPLYIRAHSKSVLQKSIFNDVLFLSHLNIMDYSLLVGISDDTGEIVVGIIDYVRTFSWDKKLEMWVKSTGFLGGMGKAPTVLSPELYKKRFLEAMETYFLMVPDRWAGFGIDLMDTSQATKP